MKTVDKTNTGTLDQKTLETEANIRSLMNNLNIVNAFGPIASILVAIFYGYVSNAHYDGWDGLLPVMFANLFLVGAFAGWFLAGWALLMQIFISMKTLPVERQSSKIEVIKHLEPTIYLFWIFNIIVLFYFGGGRTVFEGFLTGLK
jgi:hypothetical protein